MRKSRFEIRYIFAVLGLCCCLFFAVSCEEEGVKLTANDRVAIDTLSNNAINKLTLELDKECRDKADSLRKFLVDSLVAVREREIMMQTMPTH